MIFEYDELIEYVTEDFERFYDMGFNEKQIFPAILNEYEHGEDYCQLENICVHLFTALNYLEKGMKFDDIVERLDALIENEMEKDIKKELGNQYTKFVADILKIKGKI